MQLFIEKNYVLISVLHLIMSSEYPIYCTICGDDSSTSVHTSGASVFQCFLKLFGAKWKGLNFTFCDQCTNQLDLISELHHTLRALEKKLKKHEREVKDKLESSELKFERKRLYQRDQRYFKLRKQILGGNH